MFLHIILMAAPQGERGNPIVQFLPFIAIIAVFYLFMIRPQQKKAKAQKTFRESLRKGDRIVTIGGIHAKIVEVKDNTLIVEAGNGFKFELEKSAISVDVSRTLNDSNDTAAA